MRKVDLTRLVSKFHKMASELQHDAARLRASGLGPSAEALRLIATGLEDVSRNVGHAGNIRVQAEPAARPGMIGGEPAQEL
jgi:hypothetical protein